MVPPLSTNEPEGTRFHCGCGLTWIVRHVPDHNMGTQRVLGYNAWFRENRRERRRRLGLKWYQRG